MWALALVSGVVGAAEPSGLWLQHVRLVDEAGVRVVDDLTIRGDQIVGFEPPDPAWGLEPIDLTGHTVTPGLVDCHVHLSLTPSGAHLALPRDEEHELWAAHLAAYVASGVTTVLDTGIREADAYVIRELTSRGPSPDVYFLGPLLSPPGGYVSVVLPQLPPVHLAAQVQEQVHFFAPLEPVGIKITVEEGMLWRVWPLYPPEVMAALQDPTITRGLPLMAHAMAPAEYRMALELGVGAFVHPPQSTPKWLVRDVVDAGVPVMSTLSVFDSLFGHIEPERWAHPMFQERVPAIELEAAGNEAWLRTSRRAVIDHMIPNAPGVMRALASKMMIGRSVLKSRVRRMSRAVRTLHEAGVPIVMGSDSGNWPLFPFEFHGPTSVREVELLVEAGLSPQEAIRSATAEGARLLGKSDTIGAIRPGLRADLVILPSDPLEDISAFRSPAWVIRAGEMRTPAQWIRGE